MSLKPSVAVEERIADALERIASALERFEPAIDEMPLCRHPDAARAVTPQSTMGHVTYRCGECGAICDPPEG